MMKNTSDREQTESEEQEAVCPEWYRQEIRTWAEARRERFAEARRAREAQDDKS